jgi:lysine 2,3-aminomutase
VEQGDWQSELRGRIRDEAGLRNFVAVTSAATDPGRSALIEELARRKALPFATTAYFLGLARGGANDPILAQVLPDPRELLSLPYECEDPLAESSHGRGRRLVHQYRSRVLLRSSGDCPVFCRHCFRRSLLNSELGFMDEAETSAAAAYLAAHREVREVLVSGGDPLTADDDRLDGLFSRLRAARPGLLLRLCTRAPVTLPSRVTDGLLALLRRHRPLVAVVQANHPAEFAQPGVDALRAIVEAGIPLRIQTVLLRGVNDDAAVLEELFCTLAAYGASPYYLFQGDLASGTSHFRVPLSRGLELYAELRRRLSGLELPRFAVDAPGGAGKVYLPEGIAGREGKDWVLLAPDET